MRKGKRWTLLAGVALGMTALAFEACGASTTDAVVDDGGSTAVGDAPQAICPPSAPLPDAACALPEGTTCDFGACGTHLARCTGGAWVFAGNPAPSPACPEAPPEAMKSCPACWPAGKTCSYSGCAVASCSVGRWVVITECSQDAGADVQGDAELDGD